MNITLDPVTKKFTQIISPEKVCYVCGSSVFIDDHHYDCQEGRISPETVPLCRRCHRTYHNYGVDWFDDEYLDRIIEIENKRRALFGLPLMKREDVQRSKYWNKKHDIPEEKVITYNTTTKEFTQGRLL